MQEIPQNSLIMYTAQISNLFLSTIVSTNVHISKVSLTCILYMVCFTFTPELHWPRRFILILTVVELAGYTSKL